MTEEEAKTKWCPFARVATDCGPAFNRWTRGKATGATSPALCVGSECMAWRWSPGRVVNQGFREERTLEPTEGYCGLAGAVQ